MSGTIGTKLTVLSRISCSSLTFCTPSATTSRDVRGRLVDRARASAASPSTLRCSFVGGGAESFSARLSAACLSSRRLAKGCASSASMDTTQKPNIRNWSMTLRANGIHVSSRYREKASCSGTSCPARRTTTPLLSSWPCRMARAARIDGLVWYRCWIAAITSLLMRTSPGDPASMALSGSPLPLPLLARMRPSRRAPRLRRSMPELMFCFFFSFSKNPSVSSRSLPLSLRSTRKGPPPLPNTHVRTN